MELFVESTHIEHVMDPIKVQFQGNTYLKAGPSFQDVRISAKLIKIDFRESISEPKIEDDPNEFFLPE